MSFSYAVPLSLFGNLFKVTDRSLHPQLTERLRVELHADVARRVGGSGGVQTAMGPAATSFDSAHVGGDIVFYGDSLGGGGRGLLPGPRQNLSEKPVDDLGSVVRNTWRYPGDGGQGVFAASVNSVLTRAHVLGREFESRTQKLRARR